MNELETSKIKSLQSILLCANVNLANLSVQFELLNKNLEALESSLSDLYEELFSESKWGDHLDDLEKE